MSNLRSVHVMISGRVQGVAFRYCTREKAGELGLDGWVRNLADGRVEAVFQGRAPDVETVLAWCRLGPPSARVEGVQVSERPVHDGLGGFSVRPACREPEPGSDSDPGPASNP